MNEFLNDLNIETKSKTIGKNFKYVNFNGEVFYFQNFKDILTFSSEEVVLKLFNGEASITGENLKIKEISPNFISLTGKILKVEVLNV
ncbi:MAG: hypothetical protein E7359_03550 [Clostridiales bacterium]|nr:hypothetical protein [Clostridiales bacterium]